ncbi:hypothetical protein DAETH_28850 [Deinococcus aetherius]|uniref:Uncharacterized protein n=1 Tax=Deinococcus aetherius TaxID=200252 RepID=A0ABM8AGJ3_9DEIO|nr:hypothetical protein [Deinococcus aetherius]BDP42916.1 hypothetical protein DAETH_28850 [Deinococcus aetherius]
MADEQATNGWFRHRRSGQVFEAEGYAYREALKNRDLEAVDGPGERSDDSPSSKLVALRERVTALGLEWTAENDENALNALLEDRAKHLRAELDQLGIRHLPNWRPETLAEKVKAARAERVQAPPES